MSIIVYSLVRFFFNNKQVLFHEKNSFVFIYHFIIFLGSMHFIGQSPRTGPNTTR